MDRFEEGGRIEQTNQVQISEPNQQVVTAEPQAQNAYSQIANNSPQVQQMRSFSAIANQSPYAQKLTQLHAIANGSGGQNPSPIQQPKNETGLPDRLKSGIENLGGYSMDDVRVHYNSSKPAQLQAHAYAQGTEIHIAPGQEKHLPHEAWHVVQQKQGRVKPTLQMKGIAINDDSALEKEADVMGAKAWGIGGSGSRKVINVIGPIVQDSVLQGYFEWNGSEWKENDQPPKGKYKLGDEFFDKEPIIKDDEKKVAKGGDRVTIYRVQGDGSGRINVDKDGILTFDEAPLNISFGDPDHAIYFGGIDAEVITFEVNAEKFAILLGMMGKQKNRDAKVTFNDPSKPGSKMEIRDSYGIKLLEEAVVQGTGKIRGKNVFLDEVLSTTISPERVLGLKERFIKEAKDRKVVTRQLKKLFDQEYNPDQLDMDFVEKMWEIRNSDIEKSLK